MLYGWYYLFISKQKTAYELRISDWSSDVFSSDLIPEAEQEQLRAKARKAIGEQLIPAFGKLLTFFPEEYVPNARDTLAAQAMPGGEAWSRQPIRESPPPGLDPDEIHAIGLREEDGIPREMEASICQVGFVGAFAYFRA